MCRVLGLGNALVDILLKIENDSLIESLNLPKGSMQLVDQQRSNDLLRQTSMLKSVISSGGSAANTIHGLANLGIKTTFIGKVGDDEYGKYFIDDLLKNSIEADLKVGKQNTGKAITFITPDSERTFATYLGSAVELCAEDISNEDFKDFTLLHIEGYLLQNHDLIKKAVEQAKGNKIKISLDLASYNVIEENLEFLKELIDNHIDIVFANEEEAKAFTGKSYIHAVEEISGICELAVVKIGKEGSLIKKENLLIQVPAIKANCIDTTGAGDLYASGFLYGYLKNYSLRKCGEIGSLLAGKVIEIHGAKMTEYQWNSIKSELNSIIKSSE